MAARKPSRLELFVAKGEDVTFPMQHTRARDDATPVNVTGWAIRVKATRFDGTVVFEKAAALGCTLEDGTVISQANGGYNWGITHAESNVAQGLCTLDIWRTDTNQERALMIGTLQIGRDARYGS